MIDIRTAFSAEMEKNAAVVGRMTGGMGFNGDMRKVNWKPVRLICDLGYSFMPGERRVRRRKLDLNGIYGEMSLPKKISSPNIILYIHGGGFVSGSPKATRAYCSMLAKYSGCRVVSIAYRLAPEHTFPAPLLDCERAYLALRQQFPQAKICLTGESAGGNLTVALTVRLLRHQKQIPECIVPHSPVCDFSFALDRSYYEIRDNTVSEKGLVPLIKAYCPQADVKDPELSPLYFGGFAQFPPTVITGDFNETLRADAEALYHKLTEAGVQTELILMKNAFYAFAPIGASAPETMRLMLENIAFMKRAWAGGSLCTDGQSPRIL